MVCKAPLVETCNSTGETTATCGNFRRMFAIFTGIGEAVLATILEEEGGNTIASAPIPAWRDRESFNIPTDRPTINRISVTSRPIAAILITDRTGRCARLETIILFIMRQLLAFSF